MLGVHSDRIPSVLGVASGDAPRGYLPPRVEYVGFARDLEQAFNLLACGLDGTGWVSFDHLVRSELTSAAWETLVIHTEGLCQTLTQALRPQIPCNTPYKHAYSLDAFVL